MTYSNGTETVRCWYLFTLSTICNGKLLVFNAHVVGNYFRVKHIKTQTTRQELLIKDVVPCLWLCIKNFLLPFHFFFLCPDRARRMQQFYRPENIGPIALRRQKHGRCCSLFSRGLIQTSLKSRGTVLK